jgi:radical SAM protein with 4Fe4S-binding SPASM domain
MSSLRYWARLLRVFHHYRHKSSRLPFPPIRLWVELTSHCNYRCIMCPNKDLKKEDRGYMDNTLYQKIIDEARHFVFDINLAHRGESLLHPRIVEMILYAKENKLYTRLHTNGSLLTDDLARKLITSGLDRLSFSFDGYTKEAYEKIRKGGDFDKTIQNIIRFLEIKQTTKSKTPETSIEVINFESFPAAGLSVEKKRFQARFDNLPLDSFVSKDMHNWAGEIEKAREHDNYSVCPFPWNALVIFWDGAVLPCTQDFFGQYIVGNAKDSSLEDIWNGEKMSVLRKKLTGQDLEEIPTCSNCDRIWRKQFMGVPKENLLKFIQKKMP